jgi:aryl sulfotransferase
VTVPRYRNLAYDSSRWEGFAFRSDDIVITTPPKCGTTWTQMLCALLIFDTSEFGRPLARISPWLDMQTRTLASVTAELDAQTHRRFIKTHTPIDGLPWDPRVTYISVGRDPRDVSLSWNHHWDNMDPDAFFALRAEAVGLADLAELGPPPEPAPTDPAEQFWSWASSDAPAAGPTLHAILAQFQQSWDRRDEPNVALFHYSDLSTDLIGQMRRLADVLEIKVTDHRLGTLAEEATFDRMKARASDLAPNSDQGFWRSTQDFFHHGSSGQWRELLTDEDEARYQQIVRALVAADLDHWAHHGWLGS